MSNSLPLATPANSPCWLANDLENIAALICPWDHGQGADLWREILAGDQEAAMSAMAIAPNQNRGRIVRAWIAETNRELTSSPMKRQAMKRTKEFLLELFFRVASRRERRALMKLIEEQRTALDQGETINRRTMERLDACERRYVRQRRRCNRVIEALTSCSEQSAR